MITPAELPRLMIADLAESSEELEWPGIQLRRYRTPPQEISVPQIDDFAIVSYANRSILSGGIETSAWHTEPVYPGIVSVVSFGAESHWRWETPIDAFHLYLNKESLTATAAVVFERDIESIELSNVPAAKDIVLADIAARLAKEIRTGGIGGQLYVEALRCQMSVHVLRKYAITALRDPADICGLSYRQRKLVVDYIIENICNRIMLADLAKSLNLSVFHFSRQFRHTFGCPPHAFIMQKRLDHAKQQLRSSRIPLKAVAADSGFADQSHMTRCFRRQMEITPAAYRRATQSGKIRQ